MRAARNQRHEPLTSFEDKFSNIQESWTAYEKEALAIVKGFKDLDYVVWVPSLVRVYTYLKTLPDVFTKIALRPNSPRYVLTKVHRRAIHLLCYSFVIKHIDGRKEVLADVLTRRFWGHPARKAICGEIAVLYKCIVFRAECMYDIPVKDIVEGQGSQGPPTNAVKSDDSIWEKGNRIWVPDQAEEINLKIMVRNAK